MRSAFLLAAVMLAVPGCAADEPAQVERPLDAASEGSAGAPVDASSEGKEAGTEAGGSDAKPDASDGQAGSDGGADGPVAKYILGPGKADFAFQLQDLGIGYHTGAVLDEAIGSLGLGDVVARLPMENATTHETSLQVVDSDGLPVPLLGEWDYSCIQLTSSEIDGAGMPRSGFPCFDELQGCDTPAHAGIAYDRAHAYFAAREAHEQANFPTAARFISHTGHYLFAHYGAAWGAAMVLSEVGENIDSIRAHLAFTRGAGRQFNLPWGIDFSAWFADGMLDYWTGDDRVWCETWSSGSCVSWCSGSDNGHSLSLHQRTWFMSYVGGANLVLQEGASVNFFATKQAPTTLSPLGVAAQDFNTFVAAHPDRGTPYVPFAVVLDFYHGLGLGTWNKPAGQELAWNHFALGETQSTLGLLDALWPGSFRVTAASEANYIVNATMGDSVDVLTDLDDPASLLVQNSYSALLLTGAIHWTQAWKNALWNGFLANGKWVVLEGSPTHDAIFADLGAPVLAPFVPGYSADEIGIAQVLSGRVLRVASPSHDPALLSELRHHFLPFAVEGAGFSLSRTTSGAWWVTLVNNSGIDKQPHTPTTVTESPKTALLTPAAPAAIKTVTTLRSAQAPSWNAAGVQVAIAPGDVVVLEIELQ